MKTAARPILTLLHSLLFGLAAFALATPAWSQGRPIDFSVISDVPYSAAEESDLIQHVADHNLFSTSDFLVHLGDLKPDELGCAESHYATAASILGDLAVPAFVVPGDNEWVDCDDQVLGWSWWNAYFLRFEQNFCGAPTVEAQIVRPENFAFVRDGVLFIGIHHVGGINQDPVEQAARLQDDSDWVSQQLQAKVGVVRAAVVFAHESPLVEPFESAFRTAVATFSKPVAYIHGDNRDWKLNHPFLEPNLTRIQLERGTLAEPPIRVTVTMDMDPARTFVVERDPWPAGSTPLNRPPCVDAGPDFITDVGLPSALEGSASDDGVPSSGLTTTWSIVAGPGPVGLGNPGDLSTFATFSAPGTYQLRLHADDGALVTASDVFVLARGGSGGDADGDGSTDDVDSCPAVSNPGQVDSDGDGFGDDCDPDLDGDGYDAGDDCDDTDAAISPDPITAENCGDSVDNNCDGATDAADLQCGACPDGFDSDADAVCDWVDICPVDFDPGQEDTDGDGFGDACDVCPASATIDVDPDGDGVCADNCPGVWNAGQEDADGDGVGDVCDVCDVDGTGGSCSPLGTVLDIPISADEDDSEERVPSGIVSLTSSDLDLVNDATKLQMAGLRFQAVDISQGAVVHRAYLQFTADEATSGPATFMIEAEASDDSPPLTANAFDLSSRTRTAAWAGWSPPDWLAIGDAGAQQRTSDLSDVVQEIVDRPGWTSGAAMTLLLSGMDLASKRVAESRDGSIAKAPRLYVEYTPIRPVVTLSAPADGAIVVEADPVTFTGGAVDAQDGDVTASLIWVSDLDGPIGSGASFSLSSLSLGNHAITATATDSDGNTGSAGITVVVNANEAPVVTITAPTSGSSFTDTESITFVGSASDAEDGDLTGSIAWTLPPEILVGTGGTFQLTNLPLGTHVITASVTDSRGATHTADVIVTIGANTPPAVTISAPADGTTVTETDSVTFVGSAADAEEGDLSSSLSWSSDLDGFIGSGTSFSLSALSVGTHTITASVSDGEGAAGSAAISVTVSANTAPIVAITAPVDGSTAIETDSITFSGTATDGEDGDLSASLAWSSDLDGSIGAGATFSLSTLSVGSHVIVASVSDAHGASGSASIGVTVSANTPPVVSITTPLDGAVATETDSIGFAGSASDDQDGDLAPSLAWTSDLDGPIGSGAYFSLGSLSLGTHAITASVTDSHGAPGSAAISVTVNANSAPVVTITAPVDGSSSTENDAVTFTATATDDEDGDLATGLTWTSDLDGPIGGGGSFSLSNLSVGTHVITAAVTDSHGAPASSTVTISVAPNAPPVVIITLPADGSSATESDEIAFGASATDDEDGDVSGSLSWTSSLDGAIGTGAGFSLSTLSVGSHVITASVTDSHGASGSATIALAVNANTPPVVSVVAPANGSASIETESVSFAGTATDGEDGDLTASLSWTSSLDGAIGSGAGFSVSSLSVGTHTITASVSDSHGAPGSASISLDVNANVAPVVTLTSPAEGTIATETDSIGFGATASDFEDGDVGANLSWSSSLDGPIGSGEAFTLSSLSVGAHTITASVTDSHGGTGSASVSVTVNANSQPEVTITSPANGASAIETDPVAFGATATDAEDGDLAASLSWSSSLDGPIGGGAGFSLPSLSVGAHTITASVTDSHGAQGSASIAITIDPNTPPMVNITSPAGGSTSTVGNALLFGASATDAQDGDLSAALSWVSDVDGVIGSGAGFSAILSLGTHVITASVTDAHGAVGATAITLTVNAGGAPSVVITAPADGSSAVETESLAFAGTASDVEDGDLTAGLLWTSSLDGAIGSGASFSISTLSVGTHTITAIATDGASNSGSAAIRVSVGANGIPVVVIGAPLDGLSVIETDPVVFSGSATDGEDGDLASGLSWSSDLDGPIGSGASFGLSTLSVGAHTVTASVTDSHGGTGSSTVSVTVNANTPPVVAISSPADGSSTGETASVDFAATASDAEEGDLGAGLSWVSDLDGPIGSGAGFSLSTLSAGAHTITASVTDSYGAPGSAAILFTVNACAPGLDPDLDGACDGVDNCPAVFNPGQEDVDGDGTGDVCDVCPASSTIDVDPDGDGVCADNCPAIWNPAQEDGDQDGVGDVCDACLDDGAGGVCAPLGSAFDVQIESDADDSEETVETGDVTLTSSDLDMALNAGELVEVGMRFRDLQISQGATIHRAYLQFEADEDDPGPASVMIEAEASDDSSPLTSGNGDLSARARTTAWAGWSPPDWERGDAGVAQRSSDLAGLVQEVVDREGWISGSALTLIVSALDLATNRTATAHDASPADAPILHVEFTPIRPDVAITSPADGTNATVTDPLNFAGTAVDAQEGDLAASLVWTSSLDGLIGTGAGFSLESLSIGTHLITATATDGDGHTGSAEITVAVNANQAPVVTISSPSDGATSISTDPLVFSASAVDAEDGDLSAGLAWASDLDGAIGAGASFQLASLSVGAHVITATVSDSHGAPGSASISVTVEANTAPVVTIGSPVDGSVSIETDLVGFSATAVDGEDGDLGGSLSWVSDLDGPIGSGASFSLSTLSVGAHLVTASVTDAHGATGTATVGVTVAPNTAPTVSISAPGDGSSFVATEAITFAGSAADAQDGNLSGALAWVSSRDGAIGGGATFASSSLSVGTHIITASVVDAHGAPGSAAISVTVNTNTAPVVAITAPADGSTSIETDSVTFTGSASDAEEGDLSANLAWSSNLDGPIGSGTSFSTSVLSLGSHTIMASVVDGHGVPGSASIAVTVNANSAPQVTIAAPLDGSSSESGSPLTFTGSALDAEEGDLTGSLLWSSDLDGPIGAGASFTTSELSTGTHEVTATAIDSYGAEGSSSVTTIRLPEPGVEGLLAGLLGLGALARRRARPSPPGDPDV